ncbi:MAG: hypothetical protein Q7K35_00580 [bacterium]|nr:hypothetical protein [bacterium]
MKKLIKSKLFLQVIVASMVATLATAGIVGAVSTIGANISTAGTLNVDSGTLYVGTTDRVGIGTTTPFASLSINNISGDNALVIGSSTATWLKVDASGLLTVAKGATFSDTLAVTGAATLSSTLASGALTVTGAATISTTLGVTGDLSFVNASSTGTTKLSVITSDTGSISFSNENLTTTGNLAFATASSTGQVKVDTLGVASTTPANGYQLSVGNGASASSTVSMGKFCMFAGQEDGTMVYIRLSSTAANNSPFATSTIPCN